MAKLQGCFCKVVVKSSMYCLLCCCAIPGCVAPKLRGALCSAHKRVYNDLPVSLRCLRAVRLWLPWLIPCDITDFVERFSSIRHDEALLFLVALIKEPKSIQYLLEALPSSQLRAKETMRGSKSNGCLVYQRDQDIKGTRQ